MPTVNEIVAHMELLAPASLAEEWDNVGLLIGDMGASVSRVLVALDATASVVTQAEEWGAELLVVHHPLIFSPLKNLVEDGGVVTLVRRLLCNCCGLLACHTNLDSAPGGLNHYVGELLGLQQLRPLALDSGLGRIGTLATPVSVAEFTARVAKILATDTLKVLGDPEKQVRTVALCTGAGGDFATAAQAAGAELYLTGEVKHHIALLARDAGMAIIDAGHYPTERPMVPLVTAHLRQLAGVEVVAAVEEEPWRRE